MMNSGNDKNSDQQKLIHLEQPIVAGSIIITHFVHGRILYIMVCSLHNRLNFELILIPPENMYQGTHSFFRVACENNTGLFLNFKQLLRSDILLLLK